LEKDPQAGLLHLTEYLADRVVGRGGGGQLDHQAVSLIIRIFFFTR